MIKSNKGPFLKFPARLISVQLFTQIKWTFSTTTPHKELFLHCLWDNSSSCGTSRIPFCRFTNLVLADMFVWTIYIFFPPNTLLWMKECLGRVPPGLKRDKTVNFSCGFLPQCAQSCFLNQFLQAVILLLLSLKELLSTCLRLLTSRMTSLRMIGVYHLHCRAVTMFFSSSFKCCPVLFFFYRCLRGRN